MRLSEKNEEIFKLLLEYDSKNVYNSKHNHNSKNGNDQIYYNNGHGVSQSQQDNCDDDNQQFAKELQAKQLNTPSNRKVAAIAGTKMKEWQCSACTYVNSQQTLECGMCRCLRHEVHNINDELQHGDAWQNSFQDKYVRVDENSYVIDNNNINDVPFGGQMIYNHMEPFEFAYNNSRDNNNNINNRQYKQEFEWAASDIATYNTNPKRVYNALKSVTTKLYKDDPKYRTLDTTNPVVIEKLMGFEGALDFLHSLGFESDLVGAKLVCKEKPKHEVLDMALDVLKEYSRKFRVVGSKQKEDSNSDSSEQERMYNSNKQFS